MIQFRRRIVLVLLGVIWSAFGWAQSPPIDYPLNVFQCAPGKFVYGFNPVTAGMPGWFCDDAVKVAGPSNGLGLTAAGTNQGTALQLVNTHNQVTTVGSGTGVRLPAPIPYAINLTTVSNAQGVNDLLVYPTSGVQIDALGTNAPITLPAGKQLIFVAYSSGQWYSAAGGGGGGSSITPVTTGTGGSLTAPSEIYVCTTTCTVTPPPPAAGYEFCVMNATNVSTVITLGALGSGAQYENQARTAFSTAGIGTLVSSGAVADMVCILGQDSTHYLTPTTSGMWVAS